MLDCSSPRKVAVPNRPHPDLPFPKQGDNEREGGDVDVLDQNLIDPNHAEMSQENRQR